MRFALTTHVLALGLGLVSVSQAHEKTCWAPDGKTKADNETYVPCNKLGIEEDGVHSSCCNLDGKTDERDLCAQTGLCNNDGILWRGYCTDQSWESAACVNVCTDESKGGNVTGIVMLTPCGDGRYCCGDTTACCSGEDAFSIPIQEEVIQGATHSYETYKHATIGLAAVFGVVSLVALLGIFWLLKKNRSLKARQQASAPAMSKSAVTAQQQNVDPYVHDQEDMLCTDTTSMASPQHTQYQMYKPPMSPTMAEVDSNPHRYSELDATGTATNTTTTAASPHMSYNGTVSPRFDAPSHDRSYDGHR
ncbi:uncharacterized protein J7T54_000894 [Emericellopsis cladophorae]|uniref:Uncharacterized protein n=1 Tax=Emericellopsis cladophorae TaxID=2686198 RepID=A0A9Q0BFC5_9HYPO|nr:uncharacterized protein J7T54_000894 [Emericellopsis cladophorae]KAI6782751.1 hypothetical protein J7T54_000894 [Emericellopsis cladophorae]